MDSIKNNHLAGKPAHEIINEQDPTCSEGEITETEVFFSDEIEPQSSTEDSTIPNRTMHASSDYSNKPADQEHESLYNRCDAFKKFPDSSNADESTDRTNASNKVEINYLQKTYYLIVNLHNHVKAVVEKEQQKKLKEAQKKEFNHTSVLTSVIRIATDFIGYVSSPVVITPSNSMVKFKSLSTSDSASFNFDSRVTVSELRAIIQQMPEFVLLDDKVDTSKSLCLELAINMTKDEQ